MIIIFKFVIFAPGGRPQEKLRIFLLILTNILTIGGSSVSLVIKNFFERGKWNIILKQYMKNLLGNIDVWFVIFQLIHELVCEITNFWNTNKLFFF